MAATDSRSKLSKNINIFGALANHREILVIFWKQLKNVLAQVKLFKVFNFEMINAMKKNFDPWLIKLYKSILNSLLRLIEIKFCWKLTTTENIGTQSGLFTFFCILHLYSITKTKSMLSFQSYIIKLRFFVRGIEKDCSYKNIGFLILFGGA